jgi:hypothetical protein
MRLNFTYATDAEIDEGIKRLAETVRNEIAMHKKETPAKDFRPDEDGMVFGV